MDTPEVDAILQRLNRLERENRLLKRVALLGFAGVILLAAFGAKLADGPKVVEAERFIVRDPQGVERAAFGIQDDGISRLTLSDGKGASKAMLSVTKDGEAVLNLVRKGGKA